MFARTKSNTSKIKEWKYFCSSINNIIALNDKVFHSVNPVDNTPVESHRVQNTSQIDAILNESAVAGKLWSNIDPGERIGAITRIKIGLENVRDVLASRITLEMGKNRRRIYVNYS